MKKTKDDPFIKTLILPPFRYSKTRHIRIADILVDEDEPETDGYDCVAAELHHMDGVAHLRNEDGVMTLQCLSPRRIISRWLSALKRSKRRRCGGAPRSRKRDTEIAIRGEIGGDESSSSSTLVTCSTKLLNGGDDDKESGKQSKRRRCDGFRSIKRESDVGRDEIGCDESSMLTTCSANCPNGGDDKESDQARYVKDTRSFNLGVACGLIYLIVESRNEFAKMVELRKEMELLLRNAKEGLQRKKSHFNIKPLESNEMNLACSTTDLQQASSSGSDSRFSLQSGVVRDAFSQCVRNEEGGEGYESLVDMNRLEAELEAELERLEIHLDSENNSSNASNCRYSQQQRLKAAIDADCSRDGDISSSGDVIDSDEAEPEDYTDLPPCDYGVPPLELERRLHELLEARQEERIKELEAALDYAKRKLEEKENEAAWWKETATAELVSRRLVPEPSSSVASQHDSESTFCTC